jgi:hypothetical protein
MVWPKENLLAKENATGPNPLMMIAWYWSKIINKAIRNIQMFACQHLAAPFCVLINERKISVCQYLKKCQHNKWSVKYQSKYEGTSKSFRTESITKKITTTINTRREATQRIMAAKLTRLTHKIAIQLLLVAESCTIYSYRSRRPVREFWIHSYNELYKFFKVR